MDNVWEIHRWVGTILVYENIHLFLLVVMYIYCVSMRIEDCVGRFQRD